MKWFAGECVVGMPIVGKARVRIARELQDLVAADRETEPARKPISCHQRLFEQVVTEIHNS